MKQHNEHEKVAAPGYLYIVPTPIGNLEDITYRAVRTLQEVQIVACEDTRVTGRLLEHLKIEKKRLLSLHAHNESVRTNELLARLRAGDSVALVSDAGTPGISDPGSLLVSAVLEAGLPVISLPGPSAAITALVASGLPTRSVLFEGFLPHKKGRQTRLEELAGYRETIILYESPHRIIRTLRELSEHFGEDRRAVIGRELTKFYEEYNRGTLGELLADYQRRPAIKGEFVIIVEGRSAREAKREFRDKRERSRKDWGFSAETRAGDGEDHSRRDR